MSVFKENVFVLDVSGLEKYLEALMTETAVRENTRLAKPIGDQKPEWKTFGQWLQSRSWLKEIKVKVLTKSGLWLQGKTANAVTEVQIVKLYDEMAMVLHFGEQYESSSALVRWIEEQERGCRASGIPLVLMMNDQKDADNLHKLLEHLKSSVICYAYPGAEDTFVSIVALGKGAFK